MGLLVGLINWTRNLILGNPLLFWACMVANLIGVVVGGWFWYGPMLVAAPIWAVPFIPDCPLAALLATVAFFGLRNGKKWDWYNALAAFGCIKYGLWTMAFWLRHWTNGGEIEIIGVGMFITHIGLFCEGVLLVPTLGRLNLGQKLSVIGVYALSLWVDYGLVGYAVRTVGFPFYPPLTPQVHMLFALGVAASLTTLLGLGLLAWRGVRG